MAKLLVERSSAMDFADAVLIRAVKAGRLAGNVALAEAGFENKRDESTAAPLSAIYKGEIWAHGSAFSPDGRAL